MKRYLAERGVRYELRDLNRDPAARAEFLRSGFHLPPVTVIDGVAVAGFRPDRLDELLGL
ncbi:MAG: glutaredoxin family protein [Dehalococcoidia bacterium]